MGNYSAPEIGRGSKIYRMASTRNHRVLITSLVVLVFGILALYDGIVRPGAQTPVSIILVFVIIGISLYGFYLFLTRSRDMFRHPDVKKFLSSGEPGRLLTLFEQDVSGSNVKKFRDASVTGHFVISESFYRFRWAYSKEIKLAYVEESRLGMPIPFIGAAAAIVHLDNGTSIHIKCDTVAGAESLLDSLAEIAPSARYVPAGPGKSSNTPATDEAALREIVTAISQPQGALAKSSPSVSPITARSMPVSQVKLSKAELFEKQIRDLYDSLERENITASLAVIESIGDAMNTGAADILAMLLEYPDDTMRARAAFALGKLGQQLSVEPLIQALEDSSAEVRENAAIALGKIGDQRAVAPLQQVPIADVRVKKAAVSALARIDQKLNIFNQPGTGFFNTLK